MFIMQIFAARLSLTVEGLCSGRSCRPAWPDTDQSRPPGPEVPTESAG